MAPRMHQNMQLETQKLKKNSAPYPNLSLNEKGITPYSTPIVSAPAAPLYCRAFSAQPGQWPPKSKSWIRPCCAVQ